MPLVGDDEGTPFTVIVMPVDVNAPIGPRPARIIETALCAV
jgi:hypothetical protein